MRKRVMTTVAAAARAGLNHGRSRLGLTCCSLAAVAGSLLLAACIGNAPSPQAMEQGGAEQPAEAAVQLLAADMTVPVTGMLGAADLRWVGALAAVPLPAPDPGPESESESESERHTGPDLTVILPDLRVATSYGVVPRPRLAQKSHGAARADDEVRDWCRAMADRLLAVRLQPCLDKDFVDSGYRSVRGRPIVARRVMPMQPYSAGRVLLIGGTHGDELSSVSLVFEWLQQLLAAGTDYVWHVVPALNPDGLLAANPKRTNAHGVDLNRNLPTTAWRQESKQYWKTVNYEARRYPGSAPASEPETQWLVDEIAAFRPDVIISVHAPYGVLDYDGHFPAPRQLGSLDLHRLGVYPGSLGNYASRMLGIPVITIELHHAWELPPAAEVRQMWIDLNDWLTRYVGHMRRAGDATWDDELG